MWIDVTNAAGTPYGDGPITTATHWTNGAAIDKAGRFAFTMPATDPRAALLQNLRYVYCYEMVGGVATLLGAGIIDKRALAVGDPTMLTVSGPDLLAELAARTIPTLTVCEQALTYLTENEDTGHWTGSVRWISNRYGAVFDVDLPESHDGVTASGGELVTMWSEGDPNIEYVYVGCDARFDRIYITVGDYLETNRRESVLVAQYYNGSGWVDLADVWDGTAAQNMAGEWCTFNKTGAITFTRPADWTRVEPTAQAGSWFWVRLTVAPGQVTDEIRLREAAVWADVPTTDGVNQIMAYAPDTWTKTGYPQTATPKYLEIEGESVLAALIALSEQGGQVDGAPVREHFRLGPGRAITWFSAFADSGLRAVQGSLPTAGQTCLIKSLRETVDTSETVTRLYPCSNDGITLALTTRTPPAGYSLNAAEGWLQHDAGATAYGRIEAAPRYTDIQSQQADSWYEHPSMVANAVFDRALEYLRTHGEAQTFYSLEVVGAPASLGVGQTIRVVYHEYRDGYHMVDIDADLYIVGTQNRIGSDGIRTLSLDVATVDRAAQTDAGMIVGAIRDVRRVGTGSGTGTNIYISGVTDGEPPVTVPDLALNSVLLLKTGDAYPTCHPATADGLDAALSLAASGDVVWLATDTIDGDHTIPAGVCVWGRGHSILSGQITLGAGAQLNAVGVIRSGDQAGALVGIVGPESGYADVDHCWIEITNATGPAYALQVGAGEVYVRNTPVKAAGGEASYAVYGQCDNCYLYGCEPVEAQTAGVDSMPWGGGGWPSELYVATAALGVYHTTNFSDPSTQPTWATVNDGLPATDCRQFALDPFDNAGRQYVLLETNRTLYTRTGGNWTAILTPAQAVALTVQDTAGTLKYFFADPTVEGRLWVAYEGSYPGVEFGSHVTYRTVYALYSDDHGATWAASTLINEGWASERTARQIVAAGDNVWITWNTGAGANISYSTNKGASWGTAAISLSQHMLALNPLDTTHAYYGASANYGYIHRVDTAGGDVTLVDNVHSAHDLWFSPTDADHQRALYHSTIYVTTDGWASENMSVVGPHLSSCLAPWAGEDENQMLVGLMLNLGPGGNRHAIGALYGEDDTTATGIAGANVSTSPYTGSIPETCGGVAVGGVQAVNSGTGAAPHVHACIIPNAEGRAAAVSEWGDRSAWDVADYGDRHASDWAAGDSHHAAVTLGASSDEALALSGQELTLTLPPLADHAHAGVEGDGGTFDAANLTSGAATDGYVLTADGSGGAAWEAPAGGAVDAGDVTYTPAVATDWDADADPGDVDAALDQLAERVADLEGGASGMANPMTTAGDIIVGGVDGAPARLAKGTDGQVLKMVSGTVAWATDATGGGGGAFTDLSDTPASYTGQGGKYVAVKADESGLEFL